MSADGQTGGRWLVRKPDGTELRFPSLDALREYIIAGIVGPEDVVQPDGDTWARVEELAELAQLLRQVAPSTHEMARVRRPTQGPAPLPPSTRRVPSEESLARRPSAPPPPGSRELAAQPSIRRRVELGPGTQRPAPPPLPGAAGGYDEPDPLVVVELGDDLAYPIAPAPDPIATPGPGFNYDAPTIADEPIVARRPPPRRTATHESIRINPPPMPREALAPTGQRPLAGMPGTRPPSTRQHSRPIEPVSRGPASTDPFHPSTHPAAYQQESFDQPLRRPTHQLAAPSTHRAQTRATTEGPLESHVITRASAYGAAGYLDEDELQDMMRRATSRRRYWLAALATVLFVLLLYIGSRIWQDRQARQAATAVNAAATQTETTTKAPGATSPGASPGPVSTKVDAAPAATADASAASSDTVGAGPAAGGDAVESAPGLDPSAGPPASAANGPGADGAQPEGSDTHAPPATEDSAAAKAPEAKKPAKAPATKPPAAKAASASAPKAAPAKAPPAEPAAPRSKGDPNDFDGLMSAAKRSKSPSESVRLYHKALALKPTNPDALRSLGRAQMTAGQASEAISTFKSCRVKAPRYSPCLYWLGRAHDQSGQSSQARKMYQQLVDEFPDSSTAADARKRLGTQ